MLILLYSTFIQLIYFRIQLFNEKGDRLRNYFVDVEDFWKRGRYITDAQVEGTNIIRTSRKKDRLVYILQNLIIFYLAL